MSTEAGPNWRSRRGILGVIALALVLRTGALLRYAPLLDEDRDLYRQIAEQVVAGNGYARTFHALRPIQGAEPLVSLIGSAGGLRFQIEGPWREELLKGPDGATVELPTAYRPPLYPLVVAGVVWIVGTHRAVGVLHLLLGACTVALTVAAARRRKVPKHAALFAGSVVACDPLLLHLAPQIMTETIAAFLSSAILLAGSLSSGRARSGAIGLCLGLGALCRPTFFATAAVWAVGALLLRFVERFGKGGAIPADAKGRPAASPIAAGRSNDFQRAKWSVWAVHSGVAVAIFITTVAPWAVRNRLIFGRWIAATTHGGYTLQLAHNWAYTSTVVDGAWNTGWQEYNSFVGDWFGVYFPAADRPPPANNGFERASLDNRLIYTGAARDFEVEFDELCSVEAQRYIRENPLTSLRAGLTLWRRMWNIMPMDAEGLPRSLRTGIGVYYGGTFALALLGLFSIRRADWGAWLPALALIGGFTAVHFFYWADMRMRAPLTPAIALLAAQGAARFLRRAETKTPAGD